MRRVLSVIVAVVILYSIGCVAYADTKEAELGTSMYTSAAETLKVYKTLYDLSCDFTDEQLDRVFEFSLIYVTGIILYENETDNAFATEEVKRTMISGYADIIRYLGEQRANYGYGKLDRKEYIDNLFDMVEIFVNSSGK